MNPSRHWTRRRFLATTGLGLVGFGSGVALAAPPPTALTNSWEQGRDAILSRIKPPLFPTRDFNPRDFGAVGDGRTDARPAFLAAIRRCNAEGGGRVVVPRGEWWLEGPLHLLSNVHLHLDDAAVLRFRTDDPALYLPVVLTRWEGTELFNYSPLIYAYQAANVALTGGGRLEGNALDTFVKWRERQGADQRLARQMGADGVPLPQRIFGPGHWLRPAFVQFYGCHHVLCDGFTLRDSPFWCVHAVACSNVTIRRLRVESAPINSDGFDAESCRDVLVEDCYFNVGDDCVALKSGRDADGWRLGRPTEDVVLRRLEMHAPLAGSGLAIGSEMSGGVRRVYAEDIHMGYARTALNFKGNLDRGGAVEHVQVRRVRAERADTFLKFTTDYHGYRGDRHPPRFRDFLLEQLSCQEAQVAIHAVGVPEARLERLTLEDVVVERAAHAAELRHLRGLRTTRVLVNGVALAPAGDID